MSQTNYKRLDRGQRRVRARRRRPDSGHLVPIRVEHMKTRIVSIANSPRTRRLAASRVQVVPPRLSHSGSPAASLRSGTEPCGAGLTLIPTDEQIHCHRVRFPVRFRRNDELLNLLPKGVIAFPGGGITENLVDRARQMGIPVLKAA